jgi:hypothetical protein
VTTNGSTARVNGWVIDPDTPNPVDIHAYVNGGWGGSYKADPGRNEPSLPLRHRRPRQRQPAARMPVGDARRRFAVRESRLDHGHARKDRDLGLDD